MIDAPSELAARPQWVTWRYEQREGEDKLTKVPINARTGHLASTTDPNTWSTFEEASAFGPSDGVGYVLSADDPYVGIDLDHCRDPDSGALETWAKAIVRRLSSYTEISPSGTGLRIFVVGTLPPHGRRKGQIEVYCKARYLTITGDRYMAAPPVIKEREAELLEWHREVFGEARPPTQRSITVGVPSELADVEILERAQRADNGTKFWALWNGDYSMYPSQNEADLALTNHLAFWVGPDPPRIDQLFRSSGLMRDKWDRRADYREWTISKALEGRTDYYDPHYRGGAAAFGVGVHANGSVNGAAATSAEPWRTLTEMLASGPDSERMLVEALLWYGRTHWLYSHPGSGKTLLTLAVALHVAAGRDFHGLEVVQGAVAIIEEDSSDAVIADYLRTLAEIYEIDVEGLPVYFNRQHNIRVVDQAGVDVVRQMIGQMDPKPVLFIVDACERIVPSDTFSTKELDPLAQLLKLNAADGITNVVIDHTRKSQPNTEKVDLIDLLYGGRTKSAISDVMMFLSGAIKSRATLQYPKFRGQEPPHIQISFDGSAGFDVRTSAPSLPESERLCLEVINNARGRELTSSDVEKEAGLPRRTTIRALNKLIEMGYVSASGENRSRRYSPGSGRGGMFQ